MNLRLFFKRSFQAAILLNCFYSQILFSSQVYDPVRPAGNPPQVGQQMKIAPFASGVIDPKSNNPQRQADLNAASLLDPNYEKCGQNCIYQKAAEALTVQIEYVLSIRDQIQDPNLSDAAVRKIVGKFCHDTESANSCRTRYQQLTDFWLVKARRSLAEGNQNIAQLMSDSPQDVGVTEQDFLSENPPKKAGQQNYVITVNELYRLANSAVDFNNLNKIQSNDDWIQSLTGGDGTNPGLMPQRDDYPIFKKIPRDPAEPDGPQLEVRDGNNIDEKAYNAALKAWEAFAGADSRKNQQGLYATLIGRKNIKSVIDQDKAEFNQYDPNKPNLNKEPVQLTIFKGDRVQFIDEVQKLTPEQTFATQKGKTNSNQSITNNPNITGNEQITAIGESSSGTHTNFSATISPGQIQTIVVPQTQTQQNPQSPQSLQSQQPSQSMQNQPLPPSQNDLNNVQDNSDGAILVPFPDN